MRVIRDASADSLQGFVKDCIEPGSTVHTDGWVGYSRLQKVGYDHEITRRGGDPRLAAKLLPRADQSSLAM